MRAARAPRLADRLKDDLRMALGCMITVLFSTFNGADTLPVMLDSLTRLDAAAGRLETGGGG